VLSLGFTPLAGVPLLVLAAAAGAGAGELAYRGLGHALVGDHLVTRRGGLMRRTVVVPLAKVQSTRLRATAFQRRAGLASLLVDVAGHGPTPVVTDERAATAADLQDAVLGKRAAEDETRVRARR
jgi:putative membrane protein